MKRLLSFVLALIMTLTMPVSAMGIDDYEDARNISSVCFEAVEAMTELGILEGTDGVFMPKGKLERAAAAKIISYMMLGKEAADVLKTNDAPFDDVPANHWAAGYISYGVQTGIIGGYGNGNFGPEDELTHVQFAKMLLCAVGYGVKGEFAGNGWEKRVNGQAEKLGVYSGNLSADFGTVVTREEAALYAYNVLMNVDIVQYSELFGAYYAGKTAMDDEGAQTLNEKLYGPETEDKPVEETKPNHGSPNIDVKLGVPHNGAHNNQYCSITVTNYGHQTITVPMIAYANGYIVESSKSYEVPPGMYYIITFYSSKYMYLDNDSRANIFLECDGEAYYVKFDTKGLIDIKLN